LTRALVLLWIAACGAAPRAAPASDAILYLRSNVRDAQLYVDGRFIAPLDRLGGGVALSPGNHRLELRHEDYFSSYLEVALTRAERKRLALDLAAILP
jgi:hypothetical protein